MLHLIWASKSPYNRVKFGHNAIFPSLTEVDKHTIPYNLVNNAMI